MAATAARLRRAAICRLDAERPSGLTRNRAAARNRRRDPRAVRRIRSTCVFPHPRDDLDAGRQFRLSPSDRRRSHAGPATVANTDHSRTRSPSTRHRPTPTAVVRRAHRLMVNEYPWQPSAISRNGEQKVAKLVQDGELFSLGTFGVRFWCLLNRQGPADTKGTRRLQIRFVSNRVLRCYRRGTSSTSGRPTVGVMSH
jgi:hypothetical protein